VRFDNQMVDFLMSHRLKIQIISSLLC